MTGMQITKLIYFTFFRSILKEIDFYFILETSIFFLFCREKIEVNNNYWLRILRQSLVTESGLAFQSCWFSSNF